jgi:hypothetical protein
VFVLVLCVPLAACYRPYEFPKPGQPSATVKLRRVYHGSWGTQLSETAYVQGQVAQARTGNANLTAPDTTAFPIHPTAAWWQVDTNFHHSETRMVNEAYQVSTPHSVTRSESYSCGSGTSYRTCYRTVSATEYRHETKYRMVTRTVTVTDAACVSSFVLTPTVNSEYLLQHNFVGHNTCSISCFRQAAGVSERLQNVPCTSMEFRLGAPPK